MRRISHSLHVLAVIATLGSIGFASQPPTEAQLAAPHVTVRLYNFAKAPADVIDKAKAVATHIFRQAGIETVWTACPLTGEERDQYPDCRGPFGTRDLILRILPAVHDRFAKQTEVSGVAWMPAGAGFATRADIYFDRVERMTWERLRSAARGIFATNVAPAVCTALTLGMVMAHEMGHLLLGTQSHSSNGIMRTNWSRRDLEEAYFGRLRFTQRQEKRLRAGVQARCLAEQRS